MEGAFRIQKAFRSFGRIAAPALISILLLKLEQQHALVIAIMIGFLAVLASMRIAVEKPTSARKGISLRSWLMDLSLGFRVYASIPSERFFVLTNFALVALVNSILPVTIPLLIARSGMAASALGVCIGSYAIGLLLGTMLWSPIAARIFKPRVDFVFSVVTIGCALAVLSMGGAVLVLASSVFVVGVVWSSLSLLGYGKRQLAIPRSARVRLMATNIMLSQLASTVGFLISGACLTYAGQTGLQVFFFSVIGLLIVIGLAIKSPWEFLALPNDDLDACFAHYFPSREATQP